MLGATAVTMTSVDGVIPAQLAAIPTTRGRRRLLQTTSKEMPTVVVCLLVGLTVLVNLTSVSWPGAISRTALRECIKAFNTPVPG